MKFEHTQVFNIDGALRGMRNPLESWSKSDSDVDFNGSPVKMLTYYNIGKNDMKLAKQLIKAGTEHRKFLRQIFISVDITAPLYFWKEFDTYKVGTVANSTSTMHKLATTEITLKCFEIDDHEEQIESFNCNKNILFWENVLIPELECLRREYLRTKDKRYWKELIRLLPESWLQTRTVTLNYENIISMMKQRKNHKLSEWSKSFINWASGLPYIQEFTETGISAVGD